MAIFIFLIGHWYLSLFCQTFFLHRYSAHRMFTLSPLMERFFYFLTFLSQGPSFLTPKAYSILHQYHHHFSDTQDDPHSPHFHSNVGKMMWKTFKEYKRFRDEGHLTYPPFIYHYYPVWRSLDRVAESWIMVAVWGILYAIFYASFAPNGWFWFFYPLHFMMGPMQGAIVNWFGHKMGYRNFKLGDCSRNTLPLDFFLLGELFQNNHHKAPLSWNFAHKWYEVDPTYRLIQLMSWMRLVRIRA